MSFNFAKESVFCPDPDDLIVGMWCISIPVQALFPWGGDYAQTLYRSGPPGGEWKLVSRSRINRKHTQYTVSFTDIDEKIEMPTITFPGNRSQRDAEELSLDALRRTAQKYRCDPAELEVAFWRIEGPKEKMVLMQLKGDRPKGIQSDIDKGTLPPNFRTMLRANLEKWQKREDEAQAKYKAQP